MPVQYKNPWPARVRQYDMLKMFREQHPEYFEPTQQVIKSGPNAGKMGMGMSWKPRFKGTRRGPSWEKLSLMRRKLRQGAY